MNPDDTTARNRYFLMSLARIGGALGAVFGVVILGRAQTLPPKLLGIAIVLSAMMVMATLPKALAHRWRTPPDA